MVLSREETLKRKRECEATRRARIKAEKAEQEQRAKEEERKKVQKREVDRLRKQKQRNEKKASKMPPQPPSPNGSIVATTSTPTKPTMTQAQIDAIERSLTRSASSNKEYQKQRIAIHDSACEDLNKFQQKYQGDEYKLREAICPSSLELAFDEEVTQKQDDRGAENQESTSKKRSADVAGLPSASAPITRSRSRPRRILRSKKSMDWEPIDSQAVGSTGSTVGAGGGATGMTRQTPPTGGLPPVHPSSASSRGGQQAGQPFGGGFNNPLSNSSSPFGVQANSQVPTHNVSAGGGLFGSNSSSNSLFAASAVDGSSGDGGSRSKKPRFSNPP